ncbi:MAG TPA: bifunctional homocysteine S-methyltransferase/methylenetetrahydrofolate reductase [Spirochaetota bacterium]|nr:bifunctional homocysteine S-methyltransferase/methylenetetrahydrofolate reductase [Spirochaetota bacterium]HPC42163.1 bifunctional homocysteine S-methyltransferase/methylenetetrahydrofolate reductase [Spirochaetota bacterium]HQF09665.1 bifunctional homocysteine S-methyltransferase/methylenetetrahydrofolate reductase [Spirochaetota bacterium]HQH98457.1 bifunctional homocysteine S-methyltransferase/methylenetetrahydrofolate reductase [Spirochaetota bacterium]
MNSFLSMLGQGRAILFDGAMGTMIYDKGIYINQCFDNLNLTQPRLIEEIHAEYVKAGCDVLETNTFGANRVNLAKYALADKVREINVAGAALARSAGGTGILVAGSMGPLSTNVEPLGAVRCEEAEEAYREQAEALVEGGVDLLILETFDQIDMLEAALDAVLAPKKVPVIAQVSVNEDGRTTYGTSLKQAVQFLNGTGADVIGLNCTVGPGPMLELLKKMTRMTKKPISVQPNAGYPRHVGGRNIYMTTPEYLSEYAVQFLGNGASIIGGCCGTTPKHIRAMKQAIKSRFPEKREIIVEEAAARDTVDAVPLEKKSAMAAKLARGEFVVSVEITPPRGCDAGAVIESSKLLKQNGIDAVNIPDGPRASARLAPMPLAILLEREAGIETVLHYTCRDRNIIGMQSDFLGAYAAGLRNVLIITGDPPKLGDYPDATAVFDLDSIGLVRVVHGLNHGHDIGRHPIGKPTGFLIGVGANPGFEDQEREIDRLFQKKEAGAEFVITQPVFDIRQFETFMKRIDGLGIPVIAGLWPLVSHRNAEFMNNEVPGVIVPPDILERMRRAGTGPEAVREGIDIARELLADMKGMIQGVQISAPFGRVQYALDVLKG